MYLLALLWAVANDFDPHPHKLESKKKVTQLHLTNVIKIRLLLCNNSIYQPWYPFGPFNCSYGHNDQITKKFSAKPEFFQLFINKRIHFPHFDTILFASELHTLLTEQKHPCPGQISRKPWELLSPGCVNHAECMAPASPAHCSPCSLVSASEHCQVR